MDTPRDTQTLFPSPTKGGLTLQKTLSLLGGSLVDFYQHKVFVLQDQLHEAEKQLRKAKLLARKPEKEMDEDLSTIEFPELLAKLNRIQEEVNRRKDEAIKAKQAEFAQFASDLGLSFEQFMSYGRRTRAPNGSRPSKQPMTVAYRHPDDPTLVAALKGPKPTWFKELQEAGHDMNKYRVHQ